MFLRFFSFFAFLFSVIYIRRDPDRKDNILERSNTRLELWEEHLKDPIVALDKALKCVENSCQESFVGPRTLRRKRSPIAAVGFLQSLWEKPIWKGMWPCLDPMDGVCSRTSSVEWNVPGEVWAAWRALLLSGNARGLVVG